MQGSMSQIFYLSQKYNVLIVKKRELRDAAPEGCCLTLTVYIHISPLY